MWFTILNRTKRENNLYKEALKILFEQKAENMILAYGYVTDGIENMYKYDNINIFQNLVRSGVKKIILIGSNETGVSNFKSILEKIESEDIEKQIGIAIIYDKQHRFHKKLAIKYNKKEVVGAIVGSSNLTKTCLYQNKTRGYFQKNLDILFGDYRAIKKIGEKNKNEYYERLINEVGEDIEKVKILTDGAVSVEADILLQQLIKEVEWDLDKNYMPLYMNEKYIEQLGKEERVKVLIENVEALQYVIGDELIYALENIYTVMGYMLDEKAKNMLKKSKVKFITDIEKKSKIEIINYIDENIEVMICKEDMVESIIGICRKCLLLGIFLESLKKIKGLKGKNKLNEVKEEIVLFYRNLNYISEEDKYKWKTKVQKLDKALKEAESLEGVKEVIQKSEQLEKLEIKGEKAINILEKILN